MANCSNGCITYFSRRSKFKTPCANSSPGSRTLPFVTYGRFLRPTFETLTPQVLRNGLGCWVPGLKRNLSMTWFMDKNFLLPAIFLSSAIGIFGELPLLQWGYFATGSKLSLWLLHKSFIFCPDFFHLVPILTMEALIGNGLIIELYNHRTLIRKWITCKKSPCYMRDSACRWFIVKRAKLFWSYV